MTEQGTLRVLVAEDEPAMLSLVSRHLRGLGFKVIEASEGDAAWDLAQEHRPDLVILDVMMPGMSGWEICKRLKSHGSNGGQFSSTGVIMLTGIGENLNEMTSPLFAADAWLNKPFEFTELDARIRETLGRYDKILPEGGGDDSMSASDDDDRLDDDGADNDDDADDDDDEPAESVPPPVRAAPPVRTAPPASGPRRANATAKKKAARKPAKASAKASAKKAPKKAVKKAAAKRAAPKKAAPRAAKKPAAKKAAKKPAKKASKKASKRR